MKCFVSPCVRIQQQIRKIFRIQNFSNWIATKAKWHDWFSFSIFSGDYLFFILLFSIWQKNKTQAKRVKMKISFNLRPLRCRFRVAHMHFRTMFKVLSHYHGMANINAVAKVTVGMLKGRYSTPYTPKTYTFACNARQIAETQSYRQVSLWKRLRTPHHMYQ